MENSETLVLNNIQSISCTTLLENDVLESDEGKVAEIIIFVNITESLGISCANTEGSLNDLNEDQCSKTIQFSESHSNILKIKGSISIIKKFPIKKAKVKEMLEQLV